MKFKSLLSVMMLAAVFAFANAAHAQTFGTMPVLYDASSHAVNTSGGVLPAGTYYLQTNAIEPVSYFGNGTYYDASTNLYGGSVYDASGQAGVYTIPDTSLSVGVPNTGAGGEAAATWAILAASLLASALGGTYLLRGRYELAH